MAFANSSRFCCPASSLTLRGLLRRARAVMWTCCLLAIGAHMGVSVLGTSQPLAKPAKPLTTRFVKRQPRLAKPLELRKRPGPRRRHVQRTMITVGARVRRPSVGSRLRVDGFLASLARPWPTVQRRAGWIGVNRDPQATAASILSTRAPQGAVDMSVELLDMQALDTGKHYAMVIENPADKRGIRGFLRLGLIYCIAVEKETIFGESIAYIRRVVEAMNRFTDIRTQLHGYFSVDSKELLKVPWVFLNVHGVSFQLTDSEALGLGRYLTEGGFVFSETGWVRQWDERTAAHGGELVSLKNLFMCALHTMGAAQGRDWSFELLPGDHPLYHCYFDLAGPPVSFRHSTLGCTTDPVHAVVMDARVLGIIETGDYERFFNVSTMDGTRHAHFLVNTIVFALTQEGSITNRVMDAVR